MAMPPLSDRTLHRVLRHNLQVRPDRPAISDGTRSLTHAEVWQEACRCAGGLRALGIGEGDVVVLMLDNSVDYWVLFAGISFVGATSVPTNTAYKGAMLEHVVADSGCTAAIVEDHYAAFFAAAAGDRAPLVVVRSDPAAGSLASPTATVPGEPTTNLAAVLGGPPIEPLDVAPSHTLAVMYTSGTTGRSKGALLSQVAAYTICYYPDVYGPHDEDDVVLVVCPMFHATGLFGGPLGAAEIGARTHIVPVFSASRFLDDARAAGATTTILVGTMVDFLMQQPSGPGDRSHPLRTVFVLPRPRRFAAAMDRFGIALTTAFGGTESGSVVNNLTCDDARFDSVGRVRDGWQLRLVDGDDMEVPDGSPGEAVLRSADPWTMATAYVNNPEASAALWRNGWLHTGDLLVRDGEGWLYFVDRVKDSLRRRGENISSMEVEAAALAHPEVVDCAAVGVGDPRIDQEVKIVVQRRPGSTLTEAELVTYLVDRMPYYAVPRYVSWVTAFPRTPTGKIRKIELRDADLPSWDREEAGIVLGRRRAARPR